MVVRGGIELLITQKQIQNKIRNIIWETKGK